MCKYWSFIILFIFPLSSYAGEEDLYDFLWLDPDKTVYVLQNKIYPKEKSYYLDIGYLTNATSTFQETNGAQIKAGYFFAEEWAVEFNYISYSNTDNSTLDTVKSVAGLVPFIRRPVSTTGVFGIWSPFYGKINTFNKIYYFDWSFGFGIGSMNAESNLETAEIKDQDRFDSENFTTFMLKTTFKFHINRSFHIGIEYLNTNFESNT